MSFIHQDPRLRALCALHDQLTTALKVAAGESGHVTDRLKVLQTTWPESDPNGTFFIGETQAFLDSVGNLSTSMCHLQHLCGEKRDQWQKYLSS